MNTTNFIVSGQGDLGSTYRLMPITYVTGIQNATGNGVTITCILLSTNPDNYQ